MLPQIVFNKAKEKSDIIYFGKEDSDFEKLDLDKKEKVYLFNQFEKKQNQVIINRYDRQLVIVKAGDEKNQNRFIEEIRTAGFKAINTIGSCNLPIISIAFCGKDQHLFYAFIEGALLGYYHFDKYMKKDEEKIYIEKIVIDTSKKDIEPIKSIINIAKAVHKARDLVNEPVNYLNATKLADEIKKMAVEANIKIDILEKKKIESLRMGGILAVNKGSVDPPTFSIMEWKPENRVNKKPIVLIGKGLVYDTGGLSLKPTANSMDEMKCDMAGGAGVACALYAIALNNLPVHVVGLIPSTDNRPGGNAYAPGDIVTMHNGSTVEVLNTDAEGRLILADAISYASKFKPELIVTMATLTGSAQMAIGQNALVGMGNAKKTVLKKVVESGYEMHERVVKFPFWDEYADELKSDVADMKNLGGKMAGAITAGKFLEKFAEYPFIHLDIAGPAFLKKSVSYRPKGGTGIGVRLLYQCVKKWIE